MRVAAPGVGLEGVATGARLPSWAVNALGLLQAWFHGRRWTVLTERVDDELPKRRSDDGR